MRLTTKQASVLVRLDSGESIARSALSRALLLALQASKAVRLERAGSSYVVRGIPGRVAAFAGHECGIRDLRGFATLDPETRTGADLARLAGDTKALTINPLDGIFLRITEAAELHGKPLNATPEGCAHFIAASELPHLCASVPLWIGVENAECFLRFESCRRHFPDLDFTHASIVWRWSWGGRWQAWLRERPGKLTWFPDYDPAGLLIFSSQIRSCRPDVQLLVPNDLDELLEHGSRKLFLRQERMLDSLPPDPDVQAVASRIKRVRKAVEHQMLILSRNMADRS
jgi:hypothetical protein